MFSVTDWWPKWLIELQTRVCVIADWRPVIKWWFTRKGGARDALNDKRRRWTISRGGLLSCFPLLLLQITKCCPKVLSLSTHPSKSTNNLIKCDIFELNSHLFVDRPRLWPIYPIVHPLCHWNCGFYGQFVVCLNNLRIQLDYYSNHLFMTFPCLCHSSTGDDHHQTGSG